MTATMKNLRFQKTKARKGHLRKALDTGQKSLNSEDHMEKKKIGRTAVYWSRRPGARMSRALRAGEAAEDLGLLASYGPHQKRQTF